MWDRFSIIFLRVFSKYRVFFIIFQYFFVHVFWEGPKQFLDHFGGLSIFGAVGGQCLLKSMVCGLFVIRGCFYLHMNLCNVGARNPSCLLATTWLWCSCPLRPSPIKISKKLIFYRSERMTKKKLQTCMWMVRKLKMYGLGPFQHYFPSSF